jgi:virginiamycin B lyase
VTEFRLAANRLGPDSITTGPDGALWFTATAAGQAVVDKIGRITTDGQVTYFDLSTPASTVEGITAAPDDALWFTERGTGRIGRITTAGAITEFPLPQGGAPRHIAAGPDGALWFTENDGNRIGRITTNGVISEFPLSHDGSRPVGITAGPDGAMWFTDACNPDAAKATTPPPLASAGAGSSGPCVDDKIGRITTTGAVRSFRLPNGSGPVGIAAGPDGALWFTEFGTGKIGRITTSGKITRFSTPTARSVPTQIVAGPDGALWFTENGVSKIGRLKPPAPLRVSLTVVPRTGCASSAVRARIKVAGGEKLDRVELSLDGTRVARTKRRSLRLRLVIDRLRSGAHTLRARAADTAGQRAAVTKTFRRCE